MTAAPLAAKVAIVTGVTSGVGRAIAVELAAQGASVVGTGRRTERGEALAAEVRARGGALSFLTADVARPADCAASVAHAVATYGGLDVLVNNAGTEGPVGHFHELTEDEWDAVMDVNVKGTAFCCRYAIPPMIDRGGGLILNVASVNAVGALAHLAPYNASKAAVVQLTRSIAVEYLAQGIRANAVVLGGAEGGTGERTRDGLVRLLGGPAGDLERLDPKRAMRQDAAEVAKVFALLCHDDARLLTGATIAVDRGITAGASTSALVHLKVTGA